MTLHPLTVDTITSKDKKNALRVIKSGMITMGKYTKLVEKKFSNIFKRYCLMVNSGSSANLLAFALLKNKFSSFKIKSGDEVLIPAVCWSTSLYPIIQLGLKPVFVDIDLKTLNVDISDLEKKITKKTKCLMLIHALGNCAQMNELTKILKKKKIILIEDTCEGLGSLFAKRKLGTFGDISTFSFYFSHHITSGEGGLITCKKRKDYEVLLALRSHGWSKDIQIFRKNFKNKFNDKFQFVNLGYNLRPTDIQASILVNQISKINKFKEIRLKNYKLIKLHLIKKDIIKKNVYFIDCYKQSEPSWFGFPIILKSQLLRFRNKIADDLEKMGIHTRPIISGNFLEQPVMKKMPIAFKHKYLPSSKYVHKAGLFIGLPSNRISEKKANKIAKTIEKIFLKLK